LDSDAREKYQSELISKLKELKDVVWSGDGRFDSMGHNAKFGAYTMFSNTLLKIVHFEIQVTSQNSYMLCLLRIICISWLLSPTSLCAINNAKGK